MKPLGRKSRWYWAVAGVVGLVLLLAGYWLWPDPGPLEVPLGVEHAVALSYPGPELAVKPYDYGVAVSLRIANVQQRDGWRTYDIRYMLNRGGTYDITDYLTTVEGTDPVGLPAFTVVGLETLSEGVDKRIQELSQVRIGIWHYYYETMALIVGLWVIWLGLIVFWPRRREQAAAVRGPAIDPFPLRLRRYLARVNDGTLSQTDKARMEMMLIDHWRNALPMASFRMHLTVQRIGDDPRFGAAYRALIDWLHNPASSVTNAQLLEHLTPYTQVEQEGGPA